MTIERQREWEGVIFLILFALTIPAANWLIGHVGTACIPHGPCVLPVAPGLMAPSGVTMVGIALVLRDLVQRRLGTVMSALAIVVGSALSAMLAPAALVLASAMLFCCPNLPILPSIRRWRAAGWSPPLWHRVWSAWWWIQSYFSGWPSARSIFSPAKSSARRGW